MINRAKHFSIPCGIRSGHNPSAQCCSLLLQRPKKETKIFSFSPKYSEYDQRSIVKSTSSHLEAGRQSWHGRNRALDGGWFKPIWKLGKSNWPSLKKLACLIAWFTIFCCIGFPTWMSKNGEKSKKLVLYRWKRNGHLAELVVPRVAAPALGLEHHLTCFRPGEKYTTLAWPRSKKLE